MMYIIVCASADVIQVHVSGLCRVLLVYGEKHSGLKVIYRGI